MKKRAACLKASRPTSIHSNFTFIVKDARVSSQCNLHAMAHVSSTKNPSQTQLLVCSSTAYQCSNPTQAYVAYAYIGLQLSRVPSVTPSQNLRMGGSWATRSWNAFNCKARREGRAEQTYLARVLRWDMWLQEGPCIPLPVQISKYCNQCCAPDA